MTPPGPAAVKEPRLLTFELADIGFLAVEAERARRTRDAAKRAHRAACKAFYAEGGERFSDNPHDDDPETPEYREATCDLRLAYLCAARHCANVTTRFRRAVKRYDEANAAARAAQQPEH